MRVLVLGLGSMGKRRIRNLRGLDIDVIGFDTSPERREQSSELYGIKVLDTLNDALDQGPDAVVISTPPHMHKEHALAAIEGGLPFFTEVNTMRPGDMQDIIDGCRKNDVAGMPSCNVAFHPSVRRIGKILQEGKIGRMLHFCFHSGAYLPDWHPWEEIGEYYVGKKETGGGRDQIMWELGWIYTLAGRPETVFAHTKKLGEFEADIFDTYDLQIEFEGGVLGNMTVDVIQRPPSRFLEMVGTKGTLRWDYEGREVRWWNIDGGEWISHPEADDRKGYPEEKPRQGFASKDVGMAESYIEEMKEFVGVIKGGTPRFAFEDEKILLETMFEAEASSEKGIKRNVPRTS